ncbi:uncharacterized protein BO97DRAFT_423572 [Aspergillus homomorphus CBS 101889]|uniref:Uncharacterized protein n=1 Tax=Aspergillus homomorphus (strain CBS 101889) TaxID=1450537 RepID=A0A395I0P0_ASPHC|nr:hypothetical protein BO97DRAFT_423572 [Aspergillus homomorphus CBS 101889]RAL13366.1 hypothetical protein BO97DRAFT_423572 [Aspergillus homomorphus CBS 101889]
MGYTHYFHYNAKSKTWQKAWPHLIKDTKTIIAAAGVELSGPESPDGTVATAPLVSKTKGIYINGVDEDAHEPLVIGCKEYLSLGFVKTAQKPYDVVVACVLLRAAMLAPRAFVIGSDGDWDGVGDWGDARRLYRSLWPGDELECPWGEGDVVGVLVEDPSGGSTGCCPS